MAVHPALYKAVWYWKDNQLTCHALGDVKEKASKQPRQVFQDTVGDKNIYFLENVDQANQRLYKQKYQRPIKANVPNVVTVQDIKDVVTFLMIGKVPDNVLALIQCYQINNFFRGLIVYFQLYLQVHDDLLYRAVSYSNKHLKHPISAIRENLCRSYLSKIRSKIGQEYALILTGEGKYKRFHHMNNTINRSYTVKDVQLYEYLFKFSARIVWVALMRTNYKQIEAELSRIFHCKFANVGKRLTLIHSQPSLISYSAPNSSLPDNDLSVLHGNQSLLASDWHVQSPLISDIFLNQDDTDLLLSCSLYSPEFVHTKISGLEAVLTLPEELLDCLKLTVGILGQSRENFEVMLHVKQEETEKKVSVELEKMYISEEVVEVEKPSVKMYDLLHQLETPIDLFTYECSMEMDEIIDEIKYYLNNHAEDSKKAYKLWRDMKPTWK